MCQWGFPIDTTFLAKKLKIGYNTLYYLEKHICNLKGNIIMKKLKIAGISLWRILAYFIIYSFIGYIIETTYAFVVYGVIESRQSFLYGPFCSIYGVGAVIMICSLQRVKNDKTHTLFFGGFIVGSITEYVVSFIGEKLLNTRWWDYSDKFLNINGRISLIYSIFWGLLGLYLLRVVNPKVDKFIDWIKTKFNYTMLKILVALTTIFLFLNCVVSGLALDFYLTRVTVENNLDVTNKEAVVEKYNYIYKENEKLSEIIYKFWGDNTMVKTYPNVTITLANGESVLAKNYFPDIKPYYFKFKK